MLVMPDESQWIIKRNITDPASGSLQGRRGMLVMPDESQWIIKRNITDPTGPFGLAVGNRKVFPHKIGYPVGVFHVHRNVPESD
jgi:hypothetical protein